MCFMKTPKLNTKSLLSHEPPARGIEILTSIQAFVWLLLLALLTPAFQTQQELYHKTRLHPHPNKLSHTTPGMPGTSKLVKTPDGFLAKHIRCFASVLSLCRSE